MNVLAPTASVLCKIGSIVIHTTEMLSPGAHEVDRQTVEQLLIDPEVKEWVKGMDSLAMLPKMRTDEDRRFAEKPRKRR